MAMSFSGSVIPQCSSCCRRLLRLGVTSSWKAGIVQVRGKKKNAKAKTSIPVRLAEDVSGFGRKGAIVPVTIGQMRNIYFPQGRMDYLSPREKKELKDSNVVIQRDSTFDKDAPLIVKEIPEEGAKFVSEVRPTKANLDILPPAEAFKALSDIIPPSIAFYRTLIQPREPTRREKAAQQDAESTAISSTATKDSKDIYGSVSAADVATNIKALIDNTDAAGKVVIGEDDISFSARFEAAGRIERIKTLGLYDIEIKVKGHEETIRRALNVMAEGEQSEDPLRSTVMGASTVDETPRNSVAQREAVDRASMARGQPLPDGEQAADEPIRPSNISP